MIASRLLIIVATAALLPTIAFAAPPNDKFAKGIVLTGLSGDVDDATTVDATFEAGEFAFYGDGTTVWYSFTAPTEGFLQISFDANNSGGGSMSCYGVDGASVKVFPSIGTDFTYDAGAGRSAVALALTHPGTYHIAFDSGSGAGDFTFSYRFVSGGGFRVTATQGDYNPFFVYREGGAPIQFTVARYGSTEGAASVDYEVIHGNTDATDFDGGDPLTGTLSFLPGETRKSINFTLDDDATVEGSEYFTFQLSNPSANAIILGDGTSFQIDDNDGTPTNDNLADAITIVDGIDPVVPSGRATVEDAEPRGNASIWYKYIAAADGLTTFHANSLSISVYALTPGLPVSYDHLQQIRPVRGDYDPSEDPTFLDPNGVPDPTVRVTAGRTYFVAVQGYDSADDTYVVSSTFAAAATFRIEKVGYTVLESAGTVSLNIIRSGDLSQSASVTVATTDNSDDIYDPDLFSSSGPATPGADYTASSQVLDFAANVAQKTIAVTILADKKKEPIEHFHVHLSAPSGSNLTDYPADAVVHIDDAKKLDPVLYYSGRWSGALQPTVAGTGEGTIRFKLDPAGTFSGSLILDGKKLGFAGILPPPATYAPGGVSQVTVVIPRKAPLASLDLVLRYSVEKQLFTRLAGSIGVTGGAALAQFEVNLPSSFPKEFPCPVSGRFTVGLTPDLSAPAAVRVPGFFAVKVDLKGGFKLIGSLPDGSKISGGGFITTKQLSVPSGPVYTSEAIFSIPLYGGLGQLSGNLRLATVNEIAPPPAAGDGSGNIRWSHPALAKGFVTTAFGSQMSPFVSRYAVTKGGLALLGTAPLGIKIDLSGASLAATSFTATLKAKNAIEIAPVATGAPKLKVIGDTGLFTGSITPIGAAKALTFQGALLRNTSTGTGYFLNGPAAGTVTLTRTP